MKLMKKIVAAVIVLILTLSVTGCHKKDEIAVTVNGFEYTSAYYLCALINAYSEGQGEVQTALGDKFTAETDYFKQKIDDKKFDVWVKDRAIDILEEIGTYQKLCKDAKIELKDTHKTEAQNMAFYTWYYYGYAQLFEPNGVSFDTYSKFTTDSYYANLYFEHLYGEKGEKEIASADVEAKLYKDFLIADLIDVTFSSENDTEKAEIKTKLDGYLKDLQDGKKTFEEVYNDYNKVEEEEHDHDHDHEEAEGEDKAEDKTEDDTKEEPKPLDELAQVIGAKDTGYDHDYFDEISKMATDEIKLIEKKEKAGYILVVKKDIKADPYYRDNMDLTVRHLLKDDEFNKDMAKLFKDAKTDVSSYAVNRLKVKKIKEPSYQ